MIKVNDIFYSSWGYDQTNINFYKVKRIMKSMVEIVPIESRIVEEESTEYTDAVVPYPSNEGNPIKRKLKRYDDKYYINISSFQGASQWDGKAKHQTNPYFGR